MLIYSKIVYNVIKHIAFNAQIIRFLMVIIARKIAWNLVKDVFNVAQQHV